MRRIQNIYASVRENGSVSLSFFFAVARASYYARMQEVKTCPLPATAKPF